MNNQENNIRYQEVGTPLNTELNFTEHRCVQLMNGLHLERVVRLEGYINCWAIMYKEKDAYIPTEYCHMCGVKLE